MAMLLEAFHKLGAELRACFLRTIVFRRFLWFMQALLSVRGRRTLSAALPPGVPHSAFYRIFSTARWSKEGLFRKVLQGGLPLLGPKPFIPIALDDTVTKKTGLLRGQVRWLRDASNLQLEHRSKAGHRNIRYCRGLRWIHLALLTFVPGEGSLALTVGFDLAQPLKKPKFGTSKADWKEFRKAARAFSAPALAVHAVHRARGDLDATGCRERTLLMVVDGGYMNQAFLRQLPERTGVLGRVRKDTRLVYPATTQGRRRLYGDRAPSPDTLRQDDDHPWLRTECYFGGAMRSVRYKELGPVRWPKVTKGRDLRLIVVAPTPYWLPGRNRKGYHQPGYLLTTDLTTPACLLIQTYFERWQIEVVHRDLKSELGCAQPQVWSPNSVRRVTPSIAAFYALLRIAALKAFGPGRSAEAYGELPAYRRARPPRRPSPRDLLNRLRKELWAEHPGLTAELT
jgi:hypothetical protein